MQALMTSICVTTLPIFALRTFVDRSLTPREIRKSFTNQIRNPKIMKLKLAAANMLCSANAVCSKERFARRDILPLTAFLFSATFTHIAAPRHFGGK